MYRVNYHKRVRLWWWVLVVSLCLVVTATFATQTWPLILPGAVGTSSENSLGPDSDALPGLPLPTLDSPHIPVGDASLVHYNSVPPTSGPHFAVPPAMGLYQTPLPAGLQVHALEHGHIGVQYSPDADPMIVAQLRKIGAAYPGDVFVAPYPGMHAVIALTAWGRIDTFDGYDGSRIITFIEALRGRYDHGWTTQPPQE